MNVIAKTDFEVLSEYKGGTGRVLSVYWDVAAEKLRAAVRS